jgi:negative regulator of flagellin synthesis FlgM
MKIDSSIPSSTSLPKTQPKKAAGSPASVPANANVGDASSVRSAEATPAPFDSKRVEEIRQAIADGRLQIDADKIAGRLLDGVQELLAKNRPAA